jgi:hypothetical protein
MKIHGSVQAIAASAVLCLTGCGGGAQKSETAKTQVPPQAMEPNQDKLCEVSLPLIALGCKEGQKVVFLPNQWGNEQLPVYFAAMNCDLRYTVVSTKGGVVCIFKPIKPEKPVAASEAASG